MLKDREAWNAYMREYRRTHPEYDKRRNEQRNILRGKKREWVNEYLLAHPCTDCGEGDPDVLDFDHVRGVKKANVSNLISSGNSLRALIEEVAKCDVRCANCHRRITRRREREKHN